MCIIYSMNRNLKYKKLNQYLNNANNKRYKIN